MAQNIRLGAFVVASLAVLSFFVFLVGNMESAFQANYRLQAQFQNVSGLDNGADVRVGGVHKGTVRTIQLPAQPDGKMTVVMDLARDTQSVVKKDSKAAIKSEGLVGNKYVEVSFGTKEAGDVKPGDTIGSEPPLDISDVIAKAGQILDTGKGAIENFQAAASNVDAITAKVNNGRGTIGALVNDKTMYQQASASVEALHADADALKHNFLLRGFFNKRGFTDPAEMKTYAVNQLPKDTPDKIFVYDAKKIFDKPDSTQVKGEKVLNEAGAYLETQKPVLAVIEATAGPKGDSDKDLDFSQARAFAVRQYIVDHYKLDDRKVEIFGRGKTEEEASLRILIYRNGEVPAAPNATQGAKTR